MGRYPPNWDTIRRQVYDRDDYTCRNCGIRGGQYGSAELHAHHIVPISSGGSHALTNLSTMCAECHAAIHTNAVAPRTDRRQPGQSGQPPFHYVTGSARRSSNPLIHNNEDLFSRLDDLEDAKVELVDTFPQFLGALNRDQPSAEYQHLKAELQAALDDVEAQSHDLRGDVFEGRTAVNAAHQQVIETHLTLVQSFRAFIETADTELERGGADVRTAYERGVSSVLRDATAVSDAQEAFDRLVYEDRPTTEVRLEELLENSSPRENFLFVAILFGGTMLAHVLLTTLTDSSTVWMGGMSISMLALLFLAVWVLARDSVDGQRDR
ncbi:HNH endonuclease [Natronobiforma cellulositropha]|uniref:HNH endonuclease n=1 Tax=Natronobiforma cellulositropha TaxID=1679076 RepID=UPI0021D61502|nr:HNH endonuclease signature motif containing protein [Natronobiforma cellulositropha]